MKTLYAAILAIALSGCTKNSATDNCDEIQQVHASSNKIVTIGDTLKFYSRDVGGYSIYDWHGPDNLRSGKAYNAIPNAQLKNKGWYYLSVGNNSCQTKYDSVYVDVKLKQGNPPCNVPDNTLSFSNMPGDAFSYILKSYDTDGILTVEAIGSNSIEVLFHPHWKDKEPEDGIYSTVNVRSFDQTDNDYNKVYISAVRNSLRFQSYENQVVYVNHTNGKLQIRFCSLPMGAYNGISFATSASANIIQK